MGNTGSGRINSELLAKAASAQRKTTLLAVAAIVVIYIILSAITEWRFLTASNMLAILTSSIVPALVVLGFIFIFTSGIMDLSTGAMMILASNVGGILAVQLGLGYFGLIIGAVATAIGLELLNVKLILVTKIPAWIFGLGMTMVYEAIGALYNASMIAEGTQSVSIGDLYRELGAPPVNVIVIMICVVVAFLIYNRTNLGFGLRAVGSNSSVAKMMGINVSKTVLAASVVGAMFLGLASAVNMSFAGRVAPTTGLASISVIFTPLAAFLLAKAFDRIFNITVGAIICAFLLTSIFNVLTLLGVPSGTLQQVFMGAAVIICGILSQRKYKGVVQ